MIRSSLTAVPRRLPVLWAKLGVFAGAVFALTLVTSFASVFLGQALLSSHHLNVAISAPGALRSVIGVALYATVAGMIGMALGGLLRNTAAGISTFVAVFFVIPPLTDPLPSSWSSRFAQYLPSNAGEMLFGGARGLAHPLAPWTGFGVLCAYAAVMIGFAAPTPDRRDTLRGERVSAVRPSTSAQCAGGCRCDLMAPPWMPRRAPWRQRPRPR